MDEHGRGVPRFEAEVEHQPLGESDEARVNRHFRFLERESDGHNRHIFALSDLRPEDAVIQRLRRVDSQLLKDGNIVEIHFG